MPTLSTLDPDRDRAYRMAQARTILRCLVGSTVHGLGNPSTDDRDELGVCVEPAFYLLGLTRFEHLVWRTQDEGVSSGPGDLDLTIYGLRRYCQLAAKGSPTVLLPLFAPPEATLSITPAGERLRSLAPAFVSELAGRSFIGYLGGQWKSLTNQARPARARTRELSSVHGYDTKYAMHGLRIGVQGREFLTTGRITLPVPEPERARLRAVRSGEVPLAEVLDELAVHRRALEQLVEAGELAPEPDRERIDAFLVDEYRAAWD